MIPIWAKDKTGKWKVFPTHLLETFKDGKVGVSDYRCMNGEWPYALTDKWGYLFVYDAASSRSLLRKQPTNELSQAVINDKKSKSCWLL